MTHFVQASTFQDTFAGSTIDTSKWLVHGSHVVQNNQLTITGENSWQSNGIESKSSFSRTGLTIQSSVIPQNTNSHYIALGYGDWGWLGGDTYMVFLSADGATINLRYFHNGAYTENAIAGNFSGGTNYNFKLVLAASGASLFVDSGTGFPSSPNATLTQGNFTDKKITFDTYSANSNQSVKSVSVNPTAVTAPQAGTPSVQFTSPTSNLTIHDTYYDFTIPWIQTSSTLAVTVNTVNLPTSNSIKFVLDEGSSSPQIIASAQAPYSVNFVNVPKGEHTLKAYVLDANNIPTSSTPQASLASIGIGDIFMALGDSTVAGVGGGSSSTPVTNCQNATYKTADCRNFEQIDGNSYYGVMKSFTVDLAAQLESAYGYPVFIMNEGWSGDNTYGFVNILGKEAQFINRGNALKPNKYLVNYGINDVRCETSQGCYHNIPASEINSQGYQTRLQGVVDLLKNTFGATNQQIYIARFSYDTSLTAYTQPYLNAVATVIINNPGLHAGANIYDFIGGNQQYLSDIVHPNAPGYTAEATLWKNILAN